ncbi:uncharacterized protein [Montipora foliosa]|uniref:uncharacterized protein n=1 Tax=Montipora foliosa TaxID=591990 RepID=UPI0035F17295
MPATRNTNNSLQTAPVLPPTPSDIDIRPAVETGDLQAPEASNSDAGISPAMASFIARTVQAALAAEPANNQASSLATASVVSGLANPPVSSTVQAGGCSGGVLESGSSSLCSSANSFLAAGGGLSHQGRPLQSMPVIVPSFVSTFSTPSLSSSVTSAVNVPNLQNGAIRDIADRSAVLPSPLLDQAFVVGPGFSPVPAKIVAQIVAGKFTDLSDLLAVNLVQKDPEPQLLLDGRLVLTSQPRKQRRRIEDIASWMEAFAIFSLILVNHFPHRWKDLMQYQLLILRTYRHFSGRVWLDYDRSFREHAAATRLTDWSLMNAELFNFHTAGSSVRSSSLAQCHESLEPPGSSSAAIVCKSWNRGRYTAPFASCRYAHRCTFCSGAHRSSACSTKPDKGSGDDSKRRDRSPSVSGSSSRTKARRI